MGNQQRSYKLTFTGKTIKPEHYYTVMDNYIEGMSLSELSLNLGYNIATLRYFIKKNGVEIRSVKESVKKFQKQSDLKLDEYFEENMLGWLLGDGSMRIFKGGINPIFNYTDKKEDHIHYISNILDTYNIKYSISQNKKSGCFQLQTEVRPEFHKYYDLFYGYEGLDENSQKRKTLPEIKLTPIILRNWYIGDGSSSPQSGSKNHRASIACKHKNEYILNQLSELCGTVKCYPYNTKSGICHTYHFNNKALRLLLDYIGECPVEGYKYKWFVERSTTIMEASKKDEGIV